jgi:5-methylcytosine-specific restriction endonuclease McrA
MAVFVLDRRRKPLMPCSERRARVLLDRDRARVHRVQPFTIRLVDRCQEDSVLQKVAVKLDPGSKVTGIAVVRESEPPDAVAGEGRKEVVLRLIELEHRGAQISQQLTARRALRRGRCSRKLRYRAPRFDNRTVRTGWLAPSLRHRLDTTISWVNRLRRWAPVTALSMELVRFDLQKMENPEVSGVEYQQGTLAGYEIREYVLAKWDHQCVYCDAREVPLNLDHVRSRARGGSARVSNLVTACVPCNQAKGAQPIEAFLENDPERLARILAQAKAPLKDAAAVNSTRWALYGALQATALPVECSSGGRTKWNRSRLGVPKTHALDAACVGNISRIERWSVPVTQVKASGRGAYHRTRTDASGFPRGYCMREKSVRGFRTGDMVRAVVQAGKKAGAYVGRVAIRASGSFNIQTRQKVVQGKASQRVLAGRWSALTV